MAHTGNNITPSVTNCFISDGVKYSLQRYILLHHLCVLTYHCPKFFFFFYLFPEACTVAFCLVLPSSHQPALSSNRPNYAFKPSSVLEEIVPLCTANQLMKMEPNDAHPSNKKFTCKKFLNGSAAQKA